MIPPELPPRTRRSQSFNAINESQEPPPLPPPRKIQNKSRHLSGPDSFLSHREFNDEELYKFSHMVDPHTGLPYDDYQLNDSGFLYSNNQPNVLHDLSVHRAQHDSVNNSDFVHGHDLNYFPVYTGGTADVIYSTPRKDNAYGNFPSHMNSDNRFVLESDDVFLPGADSNLSSPKPNTKYCSQV